MNYLTPARVCLGRQEDIEHFHLRDEAVTAITSYVYVF